MRITDVDSLMQYRASMNPNKGSGCPEVLLYGVKKSLDIPVITFVKLSKQYLYDVEGKTHNFRFGALDDNSAPLAIFTSKSEAWKFFKIKVAEHRDFVENYYVAQAKKLNNAEKAILEALKNFPEYFI
jgi:hypothetical protein